jgi:hypothetical protein
MKTKQSFSSFTWEVGKDFEWKTLPCTHDLSKPERWMADVLTYRKRREDEQPWFFRAMVIPELWRHFAKLDGTKQSILRFAEKYGHLAVANRPFWSDGAHYCELPSRDTALAGLHSIWEYEILEMKRIRFIFDLIKEREVYKLKHKTFKELKKSVKELQDLGLQDYLSEFLVRIEDKIDAQDMTSREKARLEDYFISPKAPGSEWVFDANPEIPDDDRDYLQAIDKSILKAEIIDYHFYDKDAKLYPIKTQAILYFQQIVNKKLRDNIFVQVLFNPHKQVLEQYVVPKDLLSAMWLQVSQAMTRGTEYRACLVCGEDMVLTRRNKAKVLTCSGTCRTAKLRRERAKETTSGTVS